MGPFQVKAGMVMLAFPEGLSSQMHWAILPPCFSTQLPSSHPETSQWELELTTVGSSIPQQLANATTQDTFVFQRSSCYTFTSAPLYTLAIKMIVWPQKSECNIVLKLISYIILQPSHLFSPVGLCKTPIHMLRAEDALQVIAKGSNESGNQRSVPGSATNP